MECVVSPLHARALFFKRSPEPPPPALHYRHISREQVLRLLLEPLHLAGTLSRGWATPSPAPFLAPSLTTRAGFLRRTTSVRRN